MNASEAKKLSTPLFCKGKEYYLSEQFVIDNSVLFSLIRMRAEAGYKEHIHYYRLDGDISYGLELLGYEVKNHYSNYSTISWT